MLWSDLFAALALVLVIEGLMLFITPAGWRRAILTAAQLDDRTLRFMGLSGVVFGLVVLTVVRQFF